MSIILIVYFTFSFILAIWACVGDDGNCLFFPFIVLFGGIIIPLIWIGEINYKRYKKNFCKNIDENYEILPNPEWLRIMASSGSSYNQIYLCRDKKSNEFLVVNTAMFRESEKFISIEAMQYRKYKFYPVTR